MFYKKLNFFLYPILATVLFFTIPYYNNWLFSKVLNINFFEEAAHLSTEDRNIIRFGFSYTIYRDIKNTLANKENVLLLLPTNQYMKSRRIADVAMPEPAVFYYFTGIRAVWANSPEASRANWVFVAKGPGDYLVKKMSFVSNPDSLIRDYGRYIK